MPGAPPVSSVLPLIIQPLMRVHVEVDPADRWCAGNRRCSPRKFLSCHKMMTYMLVGPVRRLQPDLEHGLDGYV